MANRSGRLYFGVSDTPKSASTKKVLIRNPGDLIDDQLDLQVGDELIVKFNKGNKEDVFAQLKLCVNDPSHDVGPTGAIPTVSYPGYNEWSAQQLVGFVYCYGTIEEETINTYETEVEASEGLTVTIDEDVFYEKTGGGELEFEYLDSEETPGWYINETDLVDLEEYGITYEGDLSQITDPSINVSMEVITITIGPSETHYWKAFLIDKATADNYGVTKLITDIEDMEPGVNEDVPIGWGLINQLIEDKLEDMVLGQTNPTEASNWYKITLAANRESEPFTSIELPAKITSTNQLINNGEDEGGGKFWVSNHNNYFDSNGLGIGYQYDAPPTIVYQATPDDDASDYKVNIDYTFDSGQFINKALEEDPLVTPIDYVFKFFLSNDHLVSYVDLTVGDGPEQHDINLEDYGITPNFSEYTRDNIIKINFNKETISNQGAIRTIIPWYLATVGSNKQLRTSMGYDSLRAYQNGWKNINDEEVAPNPIIGLFGNDLLFGMGTDGGSDGVVRGGNNEKSEIRFCTVDLLSGVFKDLFWMNGKKATFEIPVNFKAGTGLEIGGTEINNYITEVINNYTPSANSPIFKTAILESTTLRYGGGDSVPTKIWDEISSTKYIKPTHSGGNMSMRVPSISGYSPVGLVGYNVNAVNNNESADNFYVWECYYNKLGTSNGKTTQDKKVHFGLTCTLKDTKKTLDCHFEVRMLYAKDGWAGIVGHLK